MLKQHLPKKDSASSSVKSHIATEDVGSSSQNDAGSDEVSVSSFFDAPVDVRPRCGK